MNTDSCRYGIIRGIAQIYLDDRWTFRLLVMQTDSFTYIYTGATNYNLRFGDIVSWNDDRLFWHAEDRTVWFDLVQTKVEAK